MNIRKTVFIATLVQDSALSVGGLDGPKTADTPFTMIDGRPVLSGRGLKGAALAMARRFYDPLPRQIAEAANETRPLCRSAWEFHNVYTHAVPVPGLRSGVGILQKTGARAQGVIYDQQVMPAGTRWNLEIQVDWLRCGAMGESVEGILGYVLDQHWKEGRCWLGGSVARGLGWCHLEGLQVFRLDTNAYERWIVSQRQQLPEAMATVPTVAPTRNWSFRTKDIVIEFGEYKPNPNDAAWGVDMLSVGPHDVDRTVQSLGVGGTWVTPSWGASSPASSSAPLSGVVDTDRSMVMENGTPILPGSSIRGPLRHLLSRRKRALGVPVNDPHEFPGGVGDTDSVGQVFGTTSRSSRVLIRDARADAEWVAAKLHMHAEDEFSAGAYGNSKRDVVRLLSGRFPVRVVIEGESAQTVETLTQQLDPLFAVGAVQHLAIGGHKTRGAGWGKWNGQPWVALDIVGRPAESVEEKPTPDPVQESVVVDDGSVLSPPLLPQPETFAPLRVWVVVDSKELGDSDKSRKDKLKSRKLQELAIVARAELATDTIRWWCEPSIDLSMTTAPTVFGQDWPQDVDLAVDEVAFFAAKGVWRAARTVTGWRRVLIQEVDIGTQKAQPVEMIQVPARFHRNTTRFSATLDQAGRAVVRTWSRNGEVLGYTVIQGDNDGR